METPGDWRRRVALASRAPTTYRPPAFGDFNGPLTVAPLFVQDNRRIAVLVFVTYLALLVYCLMERQARRALEHKGGKMQGLLPGGHWARPTGKNLLRVLSVYALPFVQPPTGLITTIPLLSQLLLSDGRRGLCLPDGRGTVGSVPNSHANAYVNPQTRIMQSLDRLTNPRERIMNPRERLTNA